MLRVAVLLNGLFYIYIWCMQAWVQEEALLLWADHVCHELVHTSNLTVPMEVSVYLVLNHSLI